MEEKINGELSLEELDKVTGGKHDDTENRRDERDSYVCLLCGACYVTYKEYRKHVREKHTSALIES